jgi:beta-fructofuranosidase
MSLRLPGQWIWDSWYAFDGENHHAFYLQASRALGYPNRRHRNPSVGHAISPDLKNWTVLADAIAISDEPAFDDFTTWTGSVVRDGDGLWWMFYTGTSRNREAGMVQTIGGATSPDLITWTKLGSKPLVEADARWYEKHGDSSWLDEAWRDPWVGKLPGDDLWHMLITARANHGEVINRGVMGHAISTDLRSWQVQPPLSEPGDGFGQLEVFQYAVIDGIPLIIFNCGWPEYAPETIERVGKNGGVWSKVAAGNLVGTNFKDAQLFDDYSLYAARVVEGKDGWYLLGFINEVDGVFVGELSDPIPVTADPVLGLIRRG